MCFANDGSMCLTGFTSGGAIVSFMKTSTAMPNNSQTEMGYIRTSDGGLTSLSDEREKKDIHDLKNV